MSNLKEIIDNRIEKPKMENCRVFYIDVASAPPDCVKSIMDESIRTYRTKYDSSKPKKLQTMLALPVIVAESEDEARTFAAEIKMIRILLESGRTLTVPSVEAAEEYGRQSQEKFTYEVQEAGVIHGSLETVTKRLYEIQYRYQVDEIFVVTAIRDFPKRLRSYELLSELINIPQRGMSATHKN